MIKVSICNESDNAQWRLRKKVVVSRGNLALNPTVERVSHSRAEKHIRTYSVGLEQRAILLRDIHVHGSCPLNLGINRYTVDVM